MKVNACTKICSIHNVRCCATCCHHAGECDYGDCHDASIINVPCYSDDGRHVESRPACARHSGLTPYGVGYGLTRQQVRTPAWPGGAS